MTLARGLLVLLGALSLFGLFHEQLFSKTYWSAAGALRFEVYLAACALVLGVVVWRWPAQVLRVGGGLALGWTIWWAGPVAPVVVLFFVGSCWALGRCLTKSADGLTTTLLGAAVWMTVLWTALHFPVNFWGVYLLALAVPFAFARPMVALPKVEGRAEAIGAAMLLALLGAQLLAALKPEISSDGLAMHLALPAWVANHGLWHFDHRQEIWALMPAGADALYTGVFLLGGEAAAKLLNFAFLCLTAGLLVKAGRRWTSGARAYWGAALFVSTPLVLLVTGSLFVENVWAAFLLASVFAVLEGEFGVSGVLAGSAVAVKLIAAAFAGPIVGVGMLLAGARRWRAAVLAMVFAASPYVFAYAKSGNPVFPFANTIFRSPDYYTDSNFTDGRYADLRPGLTTPYELTFESSHYIEGRGGAAGLQYLLLLLPAALLARRREQWMIVGVAVVGGVVVLVGAPNLRYLYGAMPLASLAIAWVPWTAVLGGALALNLWFLPAAGFYDQEFALFRKSDVPAYMVEHGPSVPLVERLNREAPGEPVAFFSDGAVAGLKGRAYTDSWHNEFYWKRIREAASPAEIASDLKQRGIRYVVGPTDRRALFDVVQRFMELWLDPEPQGPVGKLTLYKIRETERPVPKDTRPLGPGDYDDREPRIEYTGAWFHDNQFAEPRNGTLSYADAAGAVLRFQFEGQRVTYMFTRAVNRGIAEVWIDGALVRRVGEFADQTKWQASEVFTAPAGMHTFEVRVSGRKDRRSVGAFVDLDAIHVE